MASSHAAELVAAPGLKAAAGLRLNSRVQIATAAGVALPALGVYLMTLARGLPAGDSGDIITAAWVLGIAHAPGYPLLTMLGHVFSLLPVGSPAFRINLLSAVLNAAAVGLCALVIGRFIGDDRQNRWFGTWQVALASSVGALTLAFSHTFWSYSVVAEVFALNDFFALLLLFLLVEWERRPWKTGLFWAFAFSCGLAAANQQSIVFLAPAFVVLLVTGWRRLHKSGSPYRLGTSRWWTDLLIAGGFLVAGLLPYLYLPLAARRQPVLNTGDPSNVDRFLAHVTRRGYGTFSLAAADHPKGSPLQQLELLSASIGSSFTLIGCLVACIGLYWLIQHRRSLALALSVAFVVTGPLFVVLGNPAIDDPLWRGVLERFYILPELLVGLFVGFGALQLMHWLSVLGSSLGRLGHAAPALSGLLLALPLASLVMHFHSVDQSHDMLVENYGQDLLAPLDQDALLVMRGDVPTFAVNYLQFTQGARPDVVKLDEEWLKTHWYVQQLRTKHPDMKIPFDVYDGGTTMLADLISANIASRPVYLYGDSKEAELASKFDVLRAGLTLKLVPKGSADEWALYREKADFFEHSLHYPTETHVYPQTSFEFRLQQSYAGVPRGLGFFLEQEGRFAEAADMYRLAMKIAPDDPTNYKNLGVALLKQGQDRATVISLWEHYLQLSPNAPDADTVRKEIQRLRTQ